MMVIVSCKHTNDLIVSCSTTTSLEVENVIMVENATSWSKMQDEGRKNLMLSR